jgi:hypothetical protein
MPDLNDIEAIRDEEPVLEEQVLDRTSRVLVTLPTPDGIDGSIEVTFRQSTIAKAKGKGGTKTVCEFCVIHIATDGTRTSVCTPVTCPPRQIKT